MPLDALDVEWLWQAHLGRRPSDAECEAALREAAGRPSALRHLAGRHPEALARAPHTPPPAHGTFFSWREAAPRLLILSNCQAPNIARAVCAVSQRPLSVMALDITTPAGGREACLRAAAGADAILTAMTSAPEFIEISATALRATTKADVIGHVPLHFAGLFPDITYLQPRGQRIASPMGDYHSAIALRGFLRGEGVAQCLARHTEGDYAALGYFEQFALAQREWEKREHALREPDLSLRDWFFEHVQERPLLHSINHPTNALLAELALRLCGRLGIPAWHGQDGAIPSTFAFGGIWPVLPALAGRLGLRYATAHVYSNNTAIMDAEEFVWRSHRLYESYDRAALQDAATARGIAWQAA